MQLLKCGAGSGNTWWRSPGRHARTCGCGCATSAAASQRAPHVSSASDQLAARMAARRSGFCGSLRKPSVIVNRGSCQLGPRPASAVSRLGNVDPGRPPKAASGAMAGGGALATRLGGLASRIAVPRRSRPACARACASARPNTRTAAARAASHTAKDVVPRSPCCQRVAKLSRARGSGITLLALLCPCWWPQR